VCGLPVQELKADRDKISRSIPASVRMEAGQVWFPENAPWLDAFRKELLEFPHGSHDDQTDVLSMAVQQMLVFYQSGRIYGDLVTSAPLPPEKPAAGPPPTPPGTVHGPDETARRVMEEEAERRRRAWEVAARRREAEWDLEDDRDLEKCDPWHGVLPPARWRAEDWI
jgi:hypothetical protein